MKLLTLLLAIINRILGRVEEEQRKKEAKDAQAEYEEMERDPADWFIDSFNSMPDASSVPDDAEEANKTNSADREA